MKITSISILAALIVAAGSFTACNNAGIKASSMDMLKSEVDSISYAIGYYYAKQNQDMEWDTLNTAIIQAAMNDYYRGGDSTCLFTSEEAEAMLKGYSQKRQINAMAKIDKEGKDFLAQNAMKEGVQTTASGLQYRSITVGEGEKPSETSEVTCHYTGRLIDGTIFDSSLGGDPVTFKLNQVIPGWTEALQLMNPGSKYELVIPSELGYGARGTQGIPPNSVLVFEVELISFK